MTQYVTHYVYVLVVDGKVHGVYEEEQAAWQGVPDEFTHAEVLARILRKGKTV